VSASASQTARLSACLARLTPHLRLNRVALTGGVAIDAGLSALGLSGTRHRIADLDLVATSLDAVSEGVASAFLVSHYHAVRPGVPKFMVQLVDPVSGIRIDIFPDLVGSIADARPALVGRHRLPVLPLARILEHKALTLSRASRAAPIDPKHVRDADLLGAVLGQPVPAVAPDALTPDVYGIDGDRDCPRCEMSRDPKWPLAAKERMFELLGWTWRPQTTK
jgi:hypothetical protein